MKRAYKILAFLLLIFNGFQLQAQTNNMDFTLTSNHITQSGNTSPINSIITKAGNALTWSQSAANGNTNTTNFSILSTSGNWDPSTGLGEVTYTMALGNYECTLTITGSQEGMSAILSFIEFNKEQGDYKFNISTITYQ